MAKSRNLDEYMYKDALKELETSEKIQFIEEAAKRNNLKRQSGVTSSRLD